MRKYEVLEHKADLKIRVFGRTKEELFLNAVLGMQDCMKPEIARSEQKVKRVIEVTSPDEAALLVDFLSEVLYLVQTSREVYDKAEFIEFSETKIKAELSGKKAASFGEDIKAVTHHGLDIGQTEEGQWQATIIFDV